MRTPPSWENRENFLKKCFFKNLTKNFKIILLFLTKKKISRTKSYISETNLQNHNVLKPVMSCVL
ncbi:hypothetical protein HanIR_Chr02g0085321 [Helianthus annuus]|nr:hypothetical protein HanIR_Chr02g0085321 [Helianthus annuus]